MKRLILTLIFVLSANQSISTLQAKKDFAISNETKIRILKYAIEIGSNDVAKMIIQSKNIDLSEYKKSILSDAKRFDRKEIVNLLAKR
jgi:hypothetical protein